MLLAAPVVKVFVHRGIALVQRLRETLIHRIVRRDAVRDRVGPGQQDVAFDFVDHFAVLPFSGFDSAARAALRMLRMP